jgi:hypothetical protein
VRRQLAFLLSGILVAMALPAFAQSGGLTLPKAVEAGAAFSIGTAGSGKATLYIVGLGQVLKRDVDLGQTASFPVGTLYNAGRYVVILEESPAPESGEFDVVPAKSVADLSFLARPSRLPVDLHGGITGAVYAFDAYKNLIVAPMPVAFELGGRSDAVQKRSVITSYGAAWTEFDSTARQGADNFVASAGGASSRRVISQVPGDPCGIKMSAKPDGKQVQLATDPIRDCSGNTIPDGEVVTFTASYDGGQSTADVPIKGGIAKIDMPIHDGALISVASGVVMGNQIRWER